MKVISSRIALLTLTLPLALCRWQFLTGSTSIDNVGSSDVPSARYAPATCYDYKTNSMILFGGYSFTSSGKGYLADLWKYDIGSNTWENLAGAGVSPNSTGQYTGSADVLRPASRSEAILLCNSKDDRVFLFGGTGRNPNDLSEDAELVSYNDLWGFRLDTKTWFILRGQGVGPLNGETNNLPRARSLGAAAISEDKGVIYLYSGYDRRSMTYLNDLWSGSYTANSVTWSRLLYDAKRSFPLGTRGLFMDYDKVGDQLIVYGGESNEGLKSDVWAFSFSGLLAWRILSGNDLKNEKVNVKNPGGRARMTAAFDPDLRQIIMHGGECTTDGVSRGACNDVWIFNIVERLWTYQAGKFGGYDVASLYDSSSDRKGEFGSRLGTGSILVPASGVNQANTVGPWLYVFGGSTELGTNQPNKLHNDMWRFLSYDAPVSELEPKPTTAPIPAPPIDYSRNLGFENESTGIGLFIALGLALLFASMYYWYTMYRNMVEAALKDKEDFKKSIARANEGRNASYKPVETTQDSLEPALKTDRSDRSSDKPKDKFHTRNILLHQQVVLCGWQYLTGAKIADDQGLATLPPARYGSSSCYDSSLNAMIVFGGYGPTTQGTGFLSDLWRFNLDTNTWQNLDGSSYPPNDDGVYTTTSGLLRPAARSESILICNPKDKRVFMVGGTGRNPKNSPLLIDTISFNDFWSYSLTLRRWNCVVGLNVGPLSGEIGTFPRARSLGTGAIDESNGLFYIHGGYNLQTLNYLSDVWQYNFDAANPKWLPLPYDTTGQFPRAMRGHSLMHDPANNQLMIFGGETNQGLMVDVWTFSLDGTRTWRLVYGNQETNKKSTESRPGGRAGMSAVIDTLYRQIIIFGGRCTKDGNSRGICNDVWVYNLVQRTWKFYDGYFNEYEAPSDFGNPNQRDGTLGARHGAASIWFTSKASNPDDIDDSWLYVYGG